MEGQRHERGFIFLGGMGSGKRKGEPRDVVDLVGAQLVSQDMVPDS